MIKYKTCKQIAEESGMSKQRVMQFARDNKLPLLGSLYLWTEADEKLFYERIGKRGNRLTKKD